MRFYHRLIRTLTLPGTAGPNDPAIIIGPDMPSCMQSRYDAMLVWRPATPIGIQYQRFMGIAKDVAPHTSSKVETGWFISTATQCAYVVDAQYAINNDFATTFELLTQFGKLLQGGPNASLFNSFVSKVKIVNGELDTAAGSTSNFLGTTNNYGDIWINAPGRLIVNSSGQLIGLSGGASDYQSGFTNNYECDNWFNAGARIIVQTGAELLFDSISAPRGGRCFLTGTSDTGSIGVGGGNGFGGGTMVWRNGRAYRWEWGGYCATSAATNVMGLNLVTNGSVVCFGGAYGPSGSAFGIATYGQRVLANSSGADKTYSVNMQVTPDAGTAIWKGASNNVRYMLISDIGAAGDYPNAVAIT